MSFLWMKNVFLWVKTVFFLWIKNVLLWMKKIFLWMKNADFMDENCSREQPGDRAGDRTGPGRTVGM
jgi:hypothetical protein